MKFSELFEDVRCGNATRRRGWVGYWTWDNDQDTIILHCKDGTTLDIRLTNDVKFTVDNLLSDDWELCEPELRKI